MRKKWCLVAFAAVGLGVGAGVGADRLLNAAEAVAAKQDVKPAVTLPITRVVLFNSGVGYISRSGEVIDDARVDLTFPESDINDLLKSMVLEDFNKGRIAAVSYDSREPVARTLASFAINLNGNPTFAGIVAQMRGERVEIVAAPTATTPGGKLNGVIVGIEFQRDAAFLNLWCSEGLRSVKLADVQQLKFSNSVIETEFQRALNVLATSHDSQKKSVSLHFAGDGKRKVQVGYVIDAPIWKTSYRLLLSEKEKPYLQGWAMLENATDEDWNGVKMACISGRPVSFKMDLYNPLYVARPVVEPELFASLRPPTYRGGFERDGFRLAIPALGPFQFGNNFDFPLNRSPNDKNPTINVSVGLFGGDGLTDSNPVHPPPPAFESTFKDIRNTVNLPAGPPQPLNPGDYSKRIFNEQTEEQRKQYAANVGRELSAPIGTGGVGNLATAGALGDVFQYSIDHPVTLARQKSAMLPIVGKQIEGQKVSIYNQFVQQTHPLLGLRFKNTSGAHLNQGPITVFEGSVYAGDTRILDVQPNEERLVSYAIDLGMEVDPQSGAGTQKVTSVKAVRGSVTTITKLTEEKKYRVVNRSQADRTLLIEHPKRTNQQFKLVDTVKPNEDTADVYRFQIILKAGETKTFTVKEEKDVSMSVALSNNRDDVIEFFISLSEAPAALKQKLQTALKVKGEWDVIRRELAQIVADIQRLDGDQDRIRKNLRETPKEAEVYGTYLKKLSDQEKEIDGLTAKQKKLMADEFAARKKYDDYLANLTE